MKAYFTENRIGRFLADLVCCVIGCALIGASLAMFTIPNDIAPGGISGLATALSYVTPFRVGVWTLFLNIPLLLFAWRSLGPRSLVFALVSTVLFPTPPLPEATAMTFLTVGNISCLSTGFTSFAVKLTVTSALRSTYS